MPDYLNTAEVAQQLRVSPWWVRRLAREGLLPSVRLTPKSRLLFDPAAVEAALRPAGGTPAPVAAGDPVAAG